MLRTEFLDKLTIVAPAVAGNNVIPIMSNFWFTGDFLMAYNDKIAISVPCKTDFEGAIPRQIFDLMKNSRAKEVEFTPNEKGDELLVKAAASRVSLTMLPPEDFIFKMPASKKNSDLLQVNSKKFLAGIRACLRSTLADSVTPEQMGITLTTKGKLLVMWATNSVTMTRVEIKLTAEPDFDRVILPVQFCQQLLSFASKEETVEIEIADDHALVLIDKIKLFGLILQTEKPLKFQEVFDRHLPSEVLENEVEIPQKVELMLERSSVVADMNAEQMFVTIGVKKGVMKFHTKSGNIEVDDSVQLPDHPDVEKLCVEPRLLKEGLGEFDRMLITDGCAALSNESTIYLVAASASAKK